MNDVSTSRILTLVFTDLADSTALKSKLGDQQVGELITRHRALVSRFSAQSTGRVIDWAGDGCFLTFETPSAAVTFALHLQEAHHAQPDLPGVRVGIHMGEVTERPGPDGDSGHPRVEGLAVDLTARICGLSSPGQILLSSAVADNVRPRLGTTGFSRPVVWQVHGAYALKGYEKPMEIAEAGIEGVSSFLSPATGGVTAADRSIIAPGSRGWRSRILVAFVLAGIAIFGAAWWLRVDRDETSPQAAVTERKSIAVLPFVNMSPDADNEYFSDGITEDLLTALSKVSGLKVASRTSSFAFKGKNADIKEIGETLQVDTVLEGSVARDGDRVRITAQLIDVEDGYHLWSEAYDRELKDVFAIRSEVAQTVAKALRVTLGAAEQRAIARKPTDNLEAYQLYLKGRNAFGTLDNWALTRSYFEEAIRLDPTYALAFSGLAEYYTWSADWGHPAGEAMRMARAAAQKALALDPTLADAHIWLGMAHFWFEHDLDATIRSFESAIAMQPELASAQLWYGYVLASIGRAEEGLAIVQHGYELDPLEPNSSVTLGISLYLAHRHEEALEQLLAATTMTGENWVAHAWLARAYAATGKIPEAIAAALKAKSMGSINAEASSVLGRIYADAGMTAEAEAELAGLRARRDIPVAPPFIATVLIGLKRYDEAIVELARAAEQRSYAVMSWRVDPHLDPLRDDPRFNALLKQVGLE